MGPARTLAALVVAVGSVVPGALLGGPGPAFADHDYGGCWEGGCYDDGGSDGNTGYDDSGRRENSRGRDRGAFSPGPFTDSPVTIIICPPGTQYCGSPPPENQP